jgi:hypothetical protein
MYPTHDCSICAVLIIEQHNSSDNDNNDLTQSEDLAPWWHKPQTQSRFESSIDPQPSQPPPPPMVGRLNLIRLSIDRGIVWGAGAMAIRT